MHYELDKQALDKLDTLLTKDIIPINLLAAIPELAKQEQINNALKQALVSSSLYMDRVICAEILDLIGDPLGVEHLVYSALVNHPLIHRHQMESKGWPGTVDRVADKLTAPQVKLLIDDMVKYQVFHGATLAYANPEWVVPDMLKLLKHPVLALQHYAAYVLAFHGRDDGAQQLKDWADSSPYPIFPLAALLQLFDKTSINYLESFADPSHPIYKHERYHWSIHSHLVPMVKWQMEIKQSHTLMKRVACLYRYYGRTLNEIEVYTAALDGTTAIRPVEPPVTVLRTPSQPHTLYFAQDLLLALKDEALQQYLAEQQRQAVCQLIERANLTLEKNLLDSYSLTEFMRGMNRVRGVRSTRNWLTDAYDFVPVKIYYDQDDYLNSATDWILNPLKHRSPLFAREYI